MSTYPPFAIPTLIPTDINVRAQRVSNIYPTQTTGPYTTWKLPVRVATTASITLSGLQTVDGVSLSDGDRVLVKNQSTGSENGIYVALLSDDWQRANDLPDGSCAADLTVFVSEGTTYSDTMFICTNDSGSDVVGTDSLVFTTYGISTPVVPGGNSGDVQYNSGGSFAGSDIFTFSPTLIPAANWPNPITPLPIQGLITLGTLPASVPPPPFPAISLITAPDAVAANSYGGNIALSGGQATGNGTAGAVAITGGYSPTGQSGLVTLNGGTGGTTGGGVALVAGDGTTSGGTVEISSGTSTEGNGGDFRATLGNGVLGGGFYLSAGASNAGVGGGVQINAGQGSAGGGSITLQAAIGTGTPGGSVTLTPGTGTPNGSVNIGTSTSLLSLFGVTAFAQPTVANSPFGAGTFAANTSGIADNTATWMVAGGSNAYTIGDILQALVNIGALKA